MKTNERIAQWAKEHPLSPIHVDCVTTVMLKILDGKCKMNAEEKAVMTALYQQVKECPSQLFGADYHRLIADSQNQLDDETKMRIYEQRLLAETRLSRPAMKEFKAWIREQKLFILDAN